jgi:hypothetical protein
MILDKYTMIADDLAHDGAPTVLDTGNVSASPGNPIVLWIQGHDMVGASSMQIVDGTTSSPTDTLMDITLTAAEFNAGVQVTLPYPTKRYVKADWTGDSDGTWSCGVVLSGGQTNL